ncbi:OmpA family protein [Thalassomonas actiniarum]|uniref:OmpA family protein n=1 Tax=Thalassomonas actiniarum TaxID=485447 RepID=A0AAF0C0X0_9GAMM|nr:OmpA family protein [Thalassomonas actiniarum]WDD97027.1 OmpA family protein [Thalassomonas actiniarum]
MKNLTWKTFTKRLWSSLTVLCGFSLLLCSPASLAETPDAKVLVGNAYFGVDSLYLTTDNDRKVNNPTNTSIDHGYGAGLHFGYRVNPTFEVRGFWSNLSLEVENNGKSPDGRMFGIDGLIFPDAKNVYFITGINMMDLQARDVAVNLGAGYRHYFQDHFALQAETKAYFTPEENHTDFSLGLSLVYFFDTNKPRISKPVDSDRDGIPDSRDLCPASPPGARVDNTGCPDSDNDGIGDNKDLCPNSPANSKVNSKGCGDNDGDGVANNLDNCPTTPQGEKVDNKGCPLYQDETVTIELLVQFDNNKSEVKARYLSEIEKVARFMKQYPKTQVELAGHTSALGDEKYNQSLSEKRARAVAKILTGEFNISPSRVSAKGYGESRLKNPDNSREAHAENRRMEAVITTEVKRSRK